MMEWAADTSKQVQFRTADHQPWEECPGDAPAWIPVFQYRIKPEPKPDVVTECRILGAYKSILWNSETNTVSGANLRLTFDGETGKLKKAEVLE
jgi:hypothetical protein